MENVVSASASRSRRKNTANRALNAAGRQANVKALFDRAFAGEEPCAHIVKYGAKALAAVILNLVRTTDPEAVVYGGGILSDARFLQKVTENLVPSVMRGVRFGLTPSAFDTQHAGLIGAASLGMQLKRRKSNGHKRVSKGA